ncbi:MlaD family protein [Jiulongibacter sp. NS-SX5]|uniref:MlaD family protein n=1 Tax=Jiulongibacter sp. NS-SX5 TaxID=3463854 RepID=UPI004057D24F
MESARKKAQVGLFMVIGLIIFAAGVLLISNMRKIFVKKITATAVFEDVSGLTKGNNVLFSGVKVGTVESLEFVPNEGVKVNFEIEEKSQEFIYKDADLKIGTDGLIGNPILVISGGSASAGAIEDQHRFKISKEDTQQDMLATLQENNKNILAITEDLKSVISSIAEGQGNLGKLIKDDGVYTQLNQTMAQLKQSSYQINAMSQNMASFSNSLNTPGKLPYELANDTTLMATLKSTVNNLDQGSSALKASAAKADQLVAGIDQDLDEILSSDSSALGVLLHDPSMAQYMKSTLINVESGTEKLDDNLEALKNSIFFRGYFRKKEKREAKAQEETQAVLSSK